MPRYSDLFAKQPAPASGGRLSALSREELQAYVDDAAPTFAQRFGNEVRANAPPNYETGTLIERGQRDLARMGQPMTLDQAAVATAGVPGLGDVVGLAADARAVYDDPSWANIGGAALGALPFVPAMGAIRAFHGSPHDFDKFDISKIGTGEGAQAYGHGLYFAEAEDTAKAYRDSLAGRGAVMSGALDSLPDRWQMDAFKALSRGNGPIRAAAIADLRAKIPKEYLPALDQAIARQGRMYEVNINAEPEEFLDWDRPIYQQGEKVQKALGFNPEDARALKKLNADYDDALLRALSGDKAAEKEAEALLGQMKQYAKMERPGSQFVGSGGVFDRVSDPDRVAPLVREGIPGIKYLDQGSRAAGEGSRNYVVFDDALVEIIRKYGLAAVLGGTGAFGLMSLQGGEDGTQPPL